MSENPIRTFITNHSINPSLFGPSTKFEFQLSSAQPRSAPSATSIAQDRYAHVAAPELDMELSTHAAAARNVWLAREDVAANQDGEELVREV